MTELIHTSTDHDHEGWKRVAEDMGDWHPDLQEHAKRHLALRGLLSKASAETTNVLAEPEAKLEVIGDPEKLKKGIKIVVGGPPHSGKSVFIEALTKNLDKGDTFAFSACPDGEGPWLQRHYDDPEVVKWRQKGQFTPEFVDRAKRVVNEWEGPLMLVDIGGRTSEENAQIVEGATHAIVLAGDLSKVGEWQEFFKSHGVEVMAVLHSHYHGNSDQIVDKDEREANPELRLGRLTASVHHLERGEPAEDKLTIKEVAASIHELVASNTAYQEAHKSGEANHFVLDLPSFLGELPGEVVEKTLPSGKVVHNRQLQRAALPMLYEQVDKSFISGQPVWLDGPINSWEAIALAAAFDETNNPDVRMRGPDGYIRLQKLPQEGAGDTVEWQVSQTGQMNGTPIITVHANVSASTRLVSPEEMATMHIPEVPEGSIVIVSTAGPNWLRSSIALGYKDHASAIAAFQPGEGSTICWAQDEASLGKIIEFEQSRLSEASGEVDSTSRVEYEVGDRVLEELDLPELPKGYGYIGGAARAVALRVLYDQDAPIRDLDIVAFDEFNPDMSHQESLSEAYMPDDYAHGYGVHGENLDTYFSSRDLTVNEVAVVDGKLILTKQAEVDLREKIIRPTTHEKEAYYGGVGPKMAVKMLLLEQVFQQEYGKGEAVEIDPSSVEPFYIALGLNKAMQYGKPIAQAFVKRLDQLGMLDRDLSIDPEKLAIELRDITDFIFRGFELAERINRGQTISPTNDLLDGDSEFDDLYDRYSRFDVVKSRARANGRGKFRATDVI